MSGPAKAPEESRAPQEPPPFATWPRLYGLVIATLVVIIVLLAWLTRAFS